MYQAVNISFRTRDRIILRDINVALRAGAFTAIVGPNGAGKSTLLKVMAHEHQTYQGEVTINGKPVQQYNAKELSRVRAVLPQASTIHFSFTVEQIMLLGRYGHPTTKKENDQILDEILSLTGLQSFRERSYLTLSGGEKQRVQLARVLAQVWQETVYPRYILLDEPTSSMDIAQQQNIFSLAKKVCERNIGVMAIVHDLNQAILFADELHFLRNGKTVATGHAHEVFTKANIEETFDCRVHVYRDPVNNCPYIIPARDSFADTPKKFSIIQ